MSKFIIHTNETGGVSVIVPVLDCGLTIEQIAAKDVPTGVSFDIVEESVVPTDWTFRDAWEKQGKTIIHNLSKAKNISHDRRRMARDKEFAPLDIQVTIPAKAAQAEIERQKIRDKDAALQIKIDAAQSIEELKALLPV